MRLLLLQLSDIHFKTAADPILGRARRVADAVRDLDHKIDFCLVALTGDVAFSGLPEQYEFAERWVDALVTELRHALRDRVPVHVVAIPGNHDVDLRTPSPARTTLIDAMLRDPRVVVDPSTEVACVQPQQAFFEFRDRVAGESLTVRGRIYYEYRFTVDATIPLDDGGPGAAAPATVRVRCLNTAWVSQNPEVPAKLVYPEPAITGDSDEGAGRDDVVVTLLHHPYNWLEPMNARAVRRALQNVSDVILTGHEHAPGVRQQQDEAGGNALYVEGVALQGHGEATPKSEFHAILIDTAHRERRVVSFEWRGGRYEEDRSPASAWAPFTSNPLRAGHRFPVSDAMRARLADPGITLSHPRRGSLTLDDIFVYPDLTEVRYQPAPRQPRLVRGENLLTAGRETGRLLITGTDDSGKTAFAKRLFLDALNEGHVPLLLDGGTVRLRGDERDRRELASVFEDQYDAPGEEYLDTPPEQRVILLDDFAAMRRGDRPQAEVLEYLTHFAGLVILFAHDVAQQVLEIVGHAPVASGRVPFAHYRLLPVSHVRREEMIDHYVSLAGSGDPASDEHLRTDMRRILAVALGKYCAPPVPVSVVSILQARAFNDQLNLSQSTYGYYYELLIKRALLSNTTLQELDVRIGYLTDLAFAAYQAGAESWSEDWLMSFHQRFTEERRLRFRYHDAIDTLLQAGILAPVGDGFAFRYKYIFYYFVSRALAGRLATPEGRGDVEDLTRHLDQQDAANILLFLTHHTKDPAVIDPMLAQAETLFRDVPRADLEPGSATIPGLDEALRDAVYEDTPIAEARRRYLERLDAAEQAAGAAEAGHAREILTPVVAEVPHRRSERDAERDTIIGGALEFVSRIYVSFRTMQILGQLLKNFPGTLSGDQKERITRAVYGVALRTLGAVHEFFRVHQDAQAHCVVEALREQYPDMTDVDLLQVARSTLYWQLRQAAFGVTQRTAADVGTPLLDPVFEEIETTDPVAAIRLISTAIRLDRAGGFPEDRVEDLARTFAGNPLALAVLRGLVVTHFHLFEVKREVKQRVCKLLDIDYRPELPRSRRRLIAGAPS